MSKSTKKIEIRETEIPMPEGGTMNYGHLIKACLDKLPQQGWTTSLMRERLDVEAKVDLNAKEIEITDKDLGIIKSCVATMTWGIKHIDLVAFEDYITSL